MRRLRVLVVLGAGLCVFAAAPGEVVGEVISAELNVVPSDEVNRLEMSLTASGDGGEISDSDTSTVTGAIKADLEIYFDPATHEVTDVNSIAFTGGRIYFSDVSFTLDFGPLFGKVNAVGTGIAATPASPSGPGPVEGESFNTLDHVLIVDEGLFNASGTGVIGGLFDPMTIDLSVEPMEISSEATGSISVALEAVEGGGATYSVTLNLPLEYDMLLLETQMFALYFQGSGVVAGTGSFTRGMCTLRSDLAGDDCLVDAADLVVFSDEWLSYSDLPVCPLSADLAYDDCYVDFADFAVLAQEWLQSPG